MEWMLLPLKRYADFSGRSRRMEYWMFALATAIFFTVVSVVFGLMLGGFAAASPSVDGTVNAGLLGGSLLMLGLFLVLALTLLVPTLAVQVRRFHDQGLSGWLVLINFIPYLGALVVLVFMCLPGNVGPNKYGPDPLAGERIGGTAY
jgi:uncharacterized membrane protein YhaH (DUF805 family)